MFFLVQIVFSSSAHVYKFLYSEVFNQPKVVEQAKAMLRKSDTLYYGVKGAGIIKWKHFDRFFFVFLSFNFCFLVFRNSDRSEKKTNHDLIPVPYRTAKAFEPAIYRNVAYDVYMNDHFKKYCDRHSNKQHQHIPFMMHNRLIERFGLLNEKKKKRLWNLEQRWISFSGVKMHLPVSYLNPPDCRRVIVKIRFFFSFLCLSSILQRFFLGNFIEFGRIICLLCWWR